MSTTKFRSWRTPDGELLRCVCDPYTGAWCALHSEKLKWEWLISLRDATVQFTPPNQEGA